MVPPHGREDVDASWNFCSTEAEAELFRAYEAASGPEQAVPASFDGRGGLSLRTRRLGGRCKDHTYRVNRADPVDVTSSVFFFFFQKKSTLAPIPRFRRRMKTVCDVLKGMKNHGFTESFVVLMDGLHHQ